MPCIKSNSSSINLFKKNSTHPISPETMVPRRFYSNREKEELSSTHGIAETKNKNLAERELIPSIPCTTWPSPPGSGCHKSVTNQRVGGTSVTTLRWGWNSGGGGFPEDDIRIFFFSFFLVRVCLFILSGKEKSGFWEI